MPEDYDPLHKASGLSRCHAESNIAVRAIDHHEICRSLISFGENLPTRAWVNNSMYSRAVARLKCAFDAKFVADEKGS